MMNDGTLSTCAPETFLREVCYTSCRKFI